MGKFTLDVLKALYDLRLLQHWAFDLIQNVSIMSVSVWYFMLYLIALINKHLRHIN